MSTITCPRCDGTGHIEDERVIGKRMRQLRLSAGVTLREMAQRLKYSPSYLSDLELGRRRWLPRLLHRYHNILGAKQ